jgi:hypothetical protein
MDSARNFLFHFEKLFINFLANKLFSKSKYCTCFGVRVVKWLMI